MCKPSREQHARAYTTREPSMVTKPIDEAERLLRSAREELARADSKASTIFAVSGIAVGAILAAVFGKQWHPSMLKSVGYEIVWWVGAGLLGIGLVLLGSSIYPRLNRAEASPPGVQFGDFHRLDPLSLLKALEEAARDPMAVRISELLNISRIVQVKYRLVRAGILCIATGLTACGLSIFFGA